jgi:hypothetical protein
VRQQHTTASLAFVLYAAFNFPELYPFTIRLVETTAQASIFLSSCVDQIDFMAGLVEPEELLRWMEIWT